MTYAEYCKTKCEWCAKGWLKSSIPGLHYPDAGCGVRDGDFKEFRKPCTAPSRDQFEQELQERIAELQEQFTRDTKRLIYLQDKLMQVDTAVSDAIGLPYGWTILTAAVDEAIAKGY